MYLWHGWWPNDEDSESRASTTGSAETRWSNDRRLAMETIKSYAQGTVLFFPATINAPPSPLRINALPRAPSPTRLRYYFLLSQIINKKHVSFSPTHGSGNLNLSRTSLERTYVWALPFVLQTLRSLISPRSTFHSNSLYLGLRG